MYKIIIQDFNGGIAGASGVFFFDDVAISVKTQTNCSRKDKNKQLHIPPPSVFTAIRVELIWVGL